MNDFPENCWYVAAWSDEIDETSVIDRTILGNRLALFRISTGEIAAFRNRCPHRSVPLSCGIREDDNLRCGYHGMLFDPQGQCLEIPGQDRIPPTARATTYPAIERAGWVWVWPGDPKLMDEALIPDINPLGDPLFQMRTGYLHYAADARLIHDNLLDFSHLQFVHRNTFGGGADWSGKPDMSRRRDGFRFERWFPDIPPPPIFRSALPEGARMDLLNIYEFDAPGILTVRTAMQPAGAAPRNAIAIDDALSNFSAQAVTPETANTAHYFFSIGLPRSEPEAALEQLLGGTLAAFEEDRTIIEVQQELLLKEPDEPIARTALEADAALNQMRGILRQMAQSERKAQMGRPSGGAST